MPNQKWPWKWFEGILLLDLFLKRGGRGVSKDTPEIQELSRLLNSPAFRPPEAPSTYRNVNGLVMQYAGFIRLDSTSRSGLTASGLFEDLWQKHQDRPDEVAETADQIKKLFDPFALTDEAREKIRRLFYTTEEGGVLSISTRVRHHEQVFAIRLAYELSALIDFDLEAHEVQCSGGIHHVDIIIEDMRVIVEYDGYFSHRDTTDRDLAKTVELEEAGWTVIRVREGSLDSIHVNDVMVDSMAREKPVADLVFGKIVDVTGADIPRLDEYLASEGPWRQGVEMGQALARAIRKFPEVFLGSEVPRKQHQDLFTVLPMRSDVGKPNTHRKDG